MNGLFFVFVLFTLLRPVRIQPCNVLLNRKSSLANPIAKPVTRIIK